MLQQPPYHRAVVGIFWRKLHICWIVGIRLGTEVCAAYVDERHLNSIRAGWIAVLPRRALKIRGRQRDDGSEALQRRCRRKDRVFASFADLAGDEATSDIWSVVISFIRVNPAYRDRCFSRPRESLTAWDPFPDQLLLEVVQFQLSSCADKLTRKGLARH